MNNLKFLGESFKKCLDENVKISLIKNFKMYQCELLRRIWVKIL